MAERGQLRPVLIGDQEYTFRNVQLLKNETLGTGSYGAVCKAKCDQLMCAAKLIWPALLQMAAPDPGKEHRRPFQRFESECQVLSRIDHPNVVKYLGTYRDPETNTAVLLMELMDESLTHYLESSAGDIPYHIQVNLASDIAQALAFLHANGIIHRDLSSNNVLLIAGSRAKVTDFGMSKFVNRTHLATMTTCPGTPAFMSPEALDEHPVYTEKIDTFSFGVLLVQIMTRQFPEPSDRFKTVQILDPQNSAHSVEALIRVPEVERRQAHISLIEPTHPLLPIALDCLKDERPSSQQLCQSLEAVKGTARYEDSLHQDPAQLLQVKDGQLRTRDEQLQANEEQLQAKDEQLQAKEEQLQAKDEELLATEDRKWRSQPDCPYHFECVSSAVIGDTAYFHSRANVYEFDINSKNWDQSEQPLKLREPAMVSIDNTLTTVGGWYGSLRGAQVKDIRSNKLYSYIDRKRLKHFPPMPTKRDLPAAVYTNNTLIVAGGRNDGCKPITAVEILNTRNKHWSKASPLPFPTSRPSMAICGEYVYLHPRLALSEQESRSVIKCSLLALVQSDHKSNVWESVASLPVTCSTLVAFNGRLLAIGGQDSRWQATNDVYQYDSSTNSWQVVSQMLYARYECCALVLPSNELMVLGGFPNRQSVEIALTTKT